MARISKRRLARLDEFLKWMSADPAIKLMAAGVCRERGLVNIGHLAQSQPKAFDELYELAKDLRDQSAGDDLPRFM